MNYRRPLFWLAIVCVLSELIAAPEAGRFLRCTAVVLLLCFFILSLRQKRLSLLPAVFLLLCCSFFGLHFRYVRRELLAARDRIAAFSALETKLDGTVAEYHYVNEQSRIRMKNARLSSAFGSLESLPADAPEALRARYQQPVGDVMIYLSAPVSVYPGQIISACGEMAPSAPPANEGEFNYPLYAAGLGLSGSMYGERAEITGGEALPYQVLIQNIREKVQHILEMLAPPKDAGVLQAMLLGDKSALDEELQTLYQENGIAHILAVSGLHLSILGMGFYRLLRRLRLHHTPAGLLAAVLILGYGILTGCSGSALRAVIMLLVQFLSRSLGRTYDMLSALSLACLLLLLYRPYLLFSAGFQLSFGAVLSLGIAAELPLAANPVLSGLLQSLFLQLFTLPIVLYHYFQLPIYSILLNLLVLPLLSFLVYAALLAICSSFLSMPFALICIGSAHGILSFYTLLCTLAGRLPGACFLPGQPKLPAILCYYLLFFLFCALLKHRQTQIEFLTQIQPDFSQTQSLFAAQQAFAQTKFAQVSFASSKPPSTLTARQSAPAKNRCIPLPLVLLPLLLALLLLPPRPPKNLTVTALDVGQGDGFVLRQGNAVVTIDMGSTSSGSLGKKVCLPYLKSQGIARIDLAILSHSDQDHISGLLYLLTETEDIAVGQLLLPAAAETDSRYNAIREAADARSIPLSYIRTGDILSFGSFSLLCLYPEDSSYIEDANSHSATFLLSANHFRMLFTGDLPVEQEPLVLENLLRYTGEYPDIDILKAGHHGSHTSSSLELLTALRPEYTLLSYGEGNRYGHPHQETLEKLTQLDISRLDTALHGEIQIQTDTAGYRIVFPMEH